MITTPDDMSIDDVLAWVESDAFVERCSAMRKRIEDGETMTAEYIAAFLGLPWSIFAGCLAKKMLEVLPDGSVVVVDTSEGVMHS